MFNINLLHLCEICENASFFGKELENGSKRVQIPTDPRSIVETYSCDDAVKHCIGQLQCLPITCSVSNRLDVISAKHNQIQSLLKVVLLV